jgi:hypothetical protein
MIFAIFMENLNEYIGSNTSVIKLHSHKSLLSTHHITLLLSSDFHITIYWMLSTNIYNTI